MKGLDEFVAAAASSGACWFLPQLPVCEAVTTALPQQLLLLWAFLFSFLFYIYFITVVSAVFDSLAIAFPLCDFCIDLQVFLN